MRQTADQERLSRLHARFVVSAGLVGTGAFFNALAWVLTHIGPLPGIDHSLALFLLGIGSMLMVFSGVVNVVCVCQAGSAYRRMRQPSAIWVNVAAGMWLVGAICLVLFVIGTSRP